MRHILSLNTLDRLNFSLISNVESFSSKSLSQLWIPFLFFVDTTGKALLSFKMQLFDFILVSFFSNFTSMEQIQHTNQRFLAT